MCGNQIAVVSYAGRIILRSVLAEAQPLYYLDNESTLPLAADPSPLTTTA